MSAAVETELVSNAIGRRVRTAVNGRESTPYQGVNKHKPTGNKIRPPIRSNSDYPGERGQARSLTSKPRCVSAGCAMA